MCTNTLIDVWRGTVVCRMLKNLAWTNRKIQLSRFLCLKYKCKQHLQIAFTVLFLCRRCDRRACLTCFPNQLDVNFLLLNINFIATLVSGPSSGIWPALQREKKLVGESAKDKAASCVDALTARVAIFARWRVEIAWRYKVTCWPSY